MSLTKREIFSAVQKYVTNDNEFSKRFTKSIRNFMFVHVGVSLVAVIVLALMCIETTGVVEILTAMMPVYIALQSANYVKSGFENWKKLSNVSLDTSHEESENG